MATIEELKNQLINAYKARYGEDAVIKLEDCGFTEPNGIFYHLILFYRNEKGVVVGNHDIYAIATNEGKTDFAWYLRDPTEFPETPEQPTQTFTEQLINKLKEDSEVVFYEIISVNEELRKAKIKIITGDNKESLYLCYLDGDNLVKQLIL